MGQTIEMERKPVVIPPANAGKLSKHSIRNVVAAVVLSRAIGEEDSTVLPIITKRNLLSQLELPAPSGSNAYTAHISELDSILQSRLNTLPHLNLSLKLLAVKTVNEKIELLIRHGKFGPDDGRLWINQIETFVDVVISIIEQPWRSIVLIGSTQLGKTMTVILCFVLEAVLFAKTGKPYKALYFAPDRISLENQTKKDYRSFLSLYDFLVETKDGEPFRFSEYQRTLAGRLHRDGESLDSPIYRRSGGRIKDELKRLMDKYHADGTRIILIVDECHWGSEERGVLGQILSFAKDLTKKGKNTKEPGDVMIAISATPFNFGNLGILKRIFCRTYLGYVGYPFWMGQLLDPRYPLRMPEHIAFNSLKIAARFGLDDFAFVSRKYYGNRAEYEKAREKKDRQGIRTPFGLEFEGVSHEDYREFCEDRLVSLVNNCLTTHNELNARGFIVRFFFKNEDVTDFLSRKRGQFDRRIKVVDWKGDDAKQSLAAHLRSNDISEQDLKAVFVTGSGRMGNRIDDADGIYYGADFAPNSNLTAVLQGLLGRMTGAKSVAPIMFMEAKLCEDLDEYIASRGRFFRRKPYHRTNRNGFTVHGESITIWIEDHVGRLTFDALNLSELAAFLQSWAAEICGARTKLGGIHQQAGRQAPTDRERFWNRFNDQIFHVIEKMLHLPNDSFVRFSQDERADLPFVDRYGLAYDGVVGFRRSGADAESNSNRPSDRLASGMKKNTNRILQPQLIVRRVQRGRSWAWEAVCIKFRLVSKMTTGQHKLLPNKKDTAYHNFSLPHERQLADEGY